MPISLGRTTRSPEDVAIRSGMAGEVERAMALLNPREREVLRLRFGLGLDRELTLDEVGRRLSITRERARQIEAKALPKMRAARGRAALIRRPCPGRHKDIALGSAENILSVRAGRGGVGGWTVAAVFYSLLCGRGACNGNLQQQLTGIRRRQRILQHWPAMPRCLLIDDDGDSREAYAEYLRGTATR